MADERPIFAIFEGGGAKGVAHIGAMKAAEENNFAFAAVAGSSAGAVVATLIAAGFRADQIFNPDSADQNILRRYKKTPTDFFGEDAWRRGKDFLDRLPYKWIFYSESRSVVCDILHNHGYFSTDEIREFINRILRDRLADLYAAYSNYGSDWKVPDRITFGNFDETIFAGDLLPLKIVATNLRTGGLEVFERALTPSVEIADAVAASIAIPVFFEPVTMKSNAKEGPYLDGGLVSNLPIWVFAEEKLKWERDFPDDPLTVIGFALTEKPSDAPPQSMLKAFGHYMLQVIQASLAGSQTVAARFVEDLEIVKVQSGFKLMEFDKSLEDFVKGYREGKDHAQAQLTAIIREPELIRQELQTQVEAIRAEIDKNRLAANRPLLQHCRGCLLQLEGRLNLRVKFAVNMEGDPDDRLVLDRRAGGAAEAFRTRDPVYQSFPDPQATEYMRKYERAMVRSGLKGAICVPIFADNRDWEEPDSLRRKEPLGVFCFDSDEDLKGDYNETGFKDFIVTRSILLRPALMFGADNG